jgi:hypothetical protein
MSHRRKNSQPRFACRPLLVEPLECRRMLAGDVEVRRSGDNLKIRGDSECNGLLVVQLSEGRYAVVGFEHDGAPTTINGKTSPVIVSGIDGNFDIDLRSGDDLLGIGNNIQRIAGLADDLGFGGIIDPQSDFGLPPLPATQLKVPRSLHLKTKDGEDGVMIIGRIGRSAHIHTDNHSDGVALANSRIGEDLFIHTEKGEDGVLLDNVSVDDYLHIDTGRDGDTLLVAGSNARHAFLTMSSGSDSLGISDTAFDRELIVRTSSGNDSVLITESEARRIDIHTDSGNDTLEMGAFEVRDDLIANLGSGRDEALIADALIGDHLLLFLGSGDDILTIDNIGVDDNVLIDAGSGRDDVQITASDVDRLLHVLMGSGNDVLSIANSTARRAILHGGSDRDTLNVDSLSFADDVDEHSFEDVNNLP